MHGWLPVVILLLTWLPTLAGADGLLSLTGAAEPAEPERATISAHHDARSDTAVRRRIAGIFGELAEFAGIDVAVASGVVTLTGPVATSSVADKAIQIARHVEGVVEVRDELKVDPRLSRRMRDLAARFRALAIDAVAFAPLAAVALVVVALFWMLGNWLSERRALLLRITHNSLIADLLAQFVRLGVAIGGLVIALNLLDATSVIGTLLGAAGIIGLAIGFAVRDTVENYVASILLSLRRPFGPDEYVDIDGVAGHVARLTTRATVLISPDGNHIRVPNANVFKATIVNYSRNPRRRFEFEVGVDTGQDLLAVQSLALRCLAGIDGVLDEPKPMVIVAGLGDSNVVIRIFGWVDQARHDLLKVRGEAIRAVKAAFDEAGVAMPEPIYNLRIDAAGRAAQAAGGNDAARGPASVPAAAAAGDIAADKTIERELAAERARGDGEDLLDGAAQSEI